MAVFAFNPATACLLALVNLQICNEYNTSCSIDLTCLQF